MIRLVVCIDFDVDTVEEAYRSLDEGLRDVRFKHGLGWETSDEAFWDDGNEIDPKYLNKKILEVIKAEAT